jgi:hypothetical protein
VLSPIPTGKPGTSPKKTHKPKHTPKPKFKWNPHHPDSRGC